MRQHSHEGGSYKFSYSELLKHARQDLVIHIPPHPRMDGRWIID